MKRAQAGDPDAYALLVQRHQRAAVRIAYAVAGGDADDVVQEAFVKAYRSLHRFREEGRFRPWVLRIVANEASNARRAAGRRRALALRTFNSADEAAGSPEDDALRAERRRTVATALATLPEADRLVIAYRWFAELSEVDIATALSCRPGTVKSRLSRAHARLRAALPKDFEATAPNDAREDHHA